MTMRVSWYLLPQAVAWVSAPTTTREMAGRSCSPNRWHTQLYQSNISLAEDFDIREDFNAPLFLKNENRIQVILKRGSNSTITVARTGIAANERQGEPESQVDPPPKGLTTEEFQNATVLFLQLPFVARSAFCEALDLEEPGLAARDLGRIHEIVTLLYEQHAQLTPQRLQCEL